MVSVNKTNQLYLDYSRVIEMCTSTALEDMPWLAVKHKGGGFDRHPSFDGGDDYKFAVAILEDKPVFVGDILYKKDNGRKAIIDKLFDDGLLRIDFDNSPAIWKSISGAFTWQPPPKPKRTFNLNGVELPCPVDYGDAEIFIAVEDVKGGIRRTNKFAFVDEEAATCFFTGLCKQLEESEIKDK